jgi:hypothetical protein
MSTNIPSLRTAPQAAAIAYGARTSILPMAWAGLLVYAAFVGLWLAFVPFSLLYVWKEPPTEALKITTATGLIAILPYSLYGAWVFRKLLRCGRLLTPDGENLEEALSLHRQFWKHAPFLSAFSLAVVLGALLLAGGMSRIPKSYAISAEATHINHYSLGRSSDRA